MIKELPHEICRMLDSIIHKIVFFVNDYSSIIDRVLSYGSRSAVAIVICIQQLTYRAKEEKQDYRYKLIALFFLMITQLKYDLTDEVVPPESWMEMRLNDFEESESQKRDIKIYKSKNLDWRKRLELQGKKEIMKAGLRSLGLSCDFVYNKSSGC